MKLKKILATKNNCYISGKKHTVKGIMVHSTGANNPELRRYVAPDDGTIGKNQYNNDFNRPKPGGIEICPHAWIGKLADGSIATVQTLPWDMVGWHSGSGSLGFAKNANNNGYIGFEICEDNLTDKAYFDKVYKETVELCAYLCKTYNLSAKDIIGHYEGHQKGIASNHGDPKHWFVKHGKSMDTLRADVSAMIAKPANTTINKYSIVKVKTTAKNYGGQSKHIAIPDFVKKATYTIKQISNTEALLSEINSWVKISDLEAVSTPSKTKQVIITATKTVSENASVTLAESLKKQGYAVSTKTI